MTAVEWLVGIVFNKEDLQDFVLVNVINEAKEMEKEQIIEAYDAGLYDTTYCEKVHAEQYYNETFKLK